MIAAAACATTAPSASPPSGDCAKNVSSRMPSARTSIGSLTGSKGAANRHIPSTSAGSIPASASAPVTASIARSHASRGSAFAYSVWPMPTIATARRITRRSRASRCSTWLVCSPGCGGAATRAGDRDIRTGQPGIVTSPRTGSSTVTKTPRSRRSASVSTSVVVRTAPAGTPAAPRIRIAAILSSVPVHARTASSTSALCSPRLAIVANRGSSSMSSRPMTFAIRAHCRSLPQWMCT